MAKYDTTQEPLVLSKSVIDLLLKCDKPADCIALYTFYYYTAKWQQTNTAKATQNYVMVALKWGEDRQANAKKELIDNGLIENITRRDYQGKIEGHYVKVNFVWGKDKTQETTSVLSLGVDSPSSSKERTNALSADSINALSADKEMLSEETDSLESELPPVLPEVPTFEEFCATNGYELGEAFMGESEGMTDCYFHSKRKAPYSVKEIEEKYKKSLKAVQNKERYFEKKAEPFDSEAEIDKLKNSHRMELQIIGLYLTAKGIVLTSKDELAAIIKRNIVKATELTAFKGKITGAMKAAVAKEQEQIREKGKADYEWKLETILKSLT